MKNNHRSEKLDALLNRTVEIIFVDGSHLRGVLYDRDSAIKYTGQILCNTPYFIMLYGGCCGFYKSNVKRIIINGGIEIKGG